jgi:hypothetical protein
LPFFTAATTRAPLANAVGLANTSATSDLSIS